MAALVMIQKLFSAWFRGP